MFRFWSRCPAGKRARRNPLALAFVLLLLAGPRPAEPAEHPAPQEDRLTEALGEFVGGAMLFVFFHELGHGLVDLLELPVVGPEEDVVDEFATMLLIAGAKEAESPEDAEAAYTALVNAAESWRLMWKGMEAKLREQPGSFPFWDEHDLDIKRYYNILCLLYGSDPGRFWPIVVKTGIPLERARRCEREFAAKYGNWERLFEGHYIDPGEPRPVPQDRGRFVFVYGRAEKPFARALEQGYREQGVWEQLVANLNEVLILPPGEVPVILQECGFENAFWDGDNRQLVLCYEMFAFFADLFAKEVREQLAAQGGGGGPGPPQQPPPPPQRHPPQTQAPEPQPGPGPEGPFGPLEPLLVTGTDGPWVLVRDSGGFELRNATDSISLLRYRTGTPGFEGRRRILAEFRAAADAGTQGVGLLCGGEEGAEFLLAVLPTGVELLAPESEGSVVSVARWPMSVALDRGVRLEAVENGDTLTVFLDGQRLGEHRDPALGRGRVGIFAWGTGTFRFTRFAVGEAGAAVPGPAPPPQPPVAQPGPAPQPPVAQPGPAPQPPVAPPTPAQPRPAVDPAFVGSWIAWREARDGGRTTLQLDLLPDGRYLQTSWAPDGSIARVWGHWQVRGDSAVFTIEGFEPRQVCDRTGCRPVTMPPESRAPLVRFGSGTIQLGSLLYYRRG